MTLSSLLSLGVFVAISFAVASSGAIFKPGDWYKRLSKPNWTPPDWAFPAVWSVLFIMIAVSGWLVYESAGFVPTIFAPFAFQLIVNALWSWLFFGLRRPDLAFVDMIALWLGCVFGILKFLQRLELVEVAVEDHSLLIPDVGRKVIGEVAGIAHRGHSSSVE